MVPESMTLYHLNTTTTHTHACTCTLALGLGGGGTTGDGILVRRALGVGDAPVRVRATWRAGVETTISC